MRKYFLAILFILLAGLSFSLSTTSNYAIILRVDSTSVYPTTIYPNSEVSLNVTLMNYSSTLDATDVNVKLYQWEMILLYLMVMVI